MGSQDPTSGRFTAGRSGRGAAVWLGRGRLPSRMGQPVPWQSGREAQTAAAGHTHAHPAQGPQHPLHSPLRRGRLAQQAGRHLHICSQQATGQQRAQGRATRPAPAGRRARLGFSPPFSSGSGPKGEHLAGRREQLQRCAWPPLCRSEQAGCRLHSTLRTEEESGDGVLCRALQ